MATAFLKDPDAKLDYSVDWSEWLEEGDSISASVWTVTAGITKISDAHANGVATIWLSGGTAETQYNVANKITTTAGRIDERTLSIIVQSR